MVHSVAASGHAALRDRPWQGVSHVVLENTSNGTLVYIVGGSCGHLDRAYKLPQRLPQKVHWAWCIAGPCRGQVDCGQQKGGGEGAARFGSLRLPHTVHWAWCITAGGAGACRLGCSSRECSKGSAGGLIRGGTCARRGFECISVAAQARWRSGQDGGTRRRCINLHCRWTRRLMKLT